ncbi:MAG: DUF763 domain-containing protein [Phycisphaerae bacterium]|nr:DUF763 domain-containing protein [Phycisphaerae bacterium]
MKRGVAHLPLHGGQAPAWLFQRMHRLAGSIVQLIVTDYGSTEALARLADPFWFQAFGCVLGFDWHSSGLTTVTCGAVKEAYKRLGGDLGIHVAGGKGGVSRKTPQEIITVGDKTGLDADRLVYASKMSAKVDSAAVQDGYELYHHNFFFDDQGRWCVVQQGMCDENGYARRYHWLETSLPPEPQPARPPASTPTRIESFVREPHNAIAAQSLTGEQLMLNMVAREAEPNRLASVEVTRMHPDEFLHEAEDMPTLFMPAHHPVLPSDVNPKWLAKVLRPVYENPPQDFEGLLAMKGIGAKTIRSLALIAEVIHGKPASRRDPATFSFAHGGKDGFPFPVDRDLYDQNIAVLEDAVRRAKLAPGEKDNALRRLDRYVR